MKAKKDEIGKLKLKIEAMGREHSSTLEGERSDMKRKLELKESELRATLEQVKGEV